MFPKDDETNRLLREATAYADAKDWVSAFRCLDQAKRRMMVSDVHYPDETWCKYPLYLSRAGRFQEAMSELDWILADLPRRARKESFMDNPNISFGKGVSKKKVYNDIIRNGKRVVEAKRKIVLRRQEKASKG